ncbi:MAG TPA: type II secretion system F family protein [Clostridia bacterium]|nr:type II secretion system F family protein [Clostridia bacterium]
MAEFLIKMADERGNVSELMEAGFSEAEVREHFAQQGYLVYWVKPRGLLAGGEIRLPQRKRVKLEQFVIFNQQFVTLIRAGLPISQALDLLSKRQRNLYFRSVLENVRDRVKSGELLSEAFEAQGVFPKIYSTTILAGEKSGNLEETLSRYIGFQRLALSFRKKLVASLIYPSILVIGVTLLLSLLITFVVPRFAALYNDMGAPLPGITAFTLAVALSIKNLLPLLLIGLGATGFLLWRWSRTDTGAAQIDKIKLRTPILGPTWLKYQVAVFSRMLATLLAGGLSLVPALETASASMQSRLMANGISVAVQSVREGQPLSRSLEATAIFPELAVEMIEVGESTGALPSMLTSVAEFYEEDVQNALSAAMSLIEPFILIFMGLVVGFILISLYMPVFSIGTTGAAGGIGSAGAGR